MQFKVNETEAVKRQVVVSIAPEELSTIENKVIKQFQKHVALPGFRKGRVPVSLVKKNYSDSIRSEVLETAMGEYYNKMLDEIEFNPIAQGKITDIQFEAVSNGLEFTVEFEVPPTIELKKVTGLKAEREVVNVTEEMVKQELAHMQQHFATVKPAEKAEEGHFITFDAQMLGEGDVPIIGRKFEDVNIEIGSGDFDEELEKQMIGLELDQDAIIRKTTTAEGEEPVTESYEITVTKLEERELPPLDDEFVQNLQDDSIDTMEQLREKLQENMVSSLERRSKQQLNSRLVDEILKENPFEVPDAMVNNYLNHVVEDVKRQMSNNKDNTGMDEDAIRQRYRPDAIYAIRWYLLKDQLIEKENLAVTDEDLQEKIDALPYDDEEKERIKANEDFNRRLRDDLQEEKVLKFLEDNAEITDVYPQDADNTEPAEAAAADVEAK